MFKGLFNRFRGQSKGDIVLINAVDGHIAEHLGPVETVLHEKVSPLIHLDLHWVKPSEEFPFHTLVTSGMAERPMSVPEGAEDFAYAEMLLLLPPDWPVEEITSSEAVYWPVRILKMLARYPHEQGTWLGAGHTIPVANEGQTMAVGTRFEAAMIVPPYFLSPKFSRLELPDGRVVNFYAMGFLDPEELELKLAEGSGAVFERAEGQDRVGELFVLTPGRASFV